MNDIFTHKELLRMSNQALQIVWRMLQKWERAVSTIYPPTDFRNMGKAPLQVAVYWIESIHAEDYG